MTATVKRVVFQRGPHGENTEATIFEVDPQTYARQQAEKQRIAAKREAESLQKFEAMRDWIGRQIEVTLATAEGRPPNLPPWHLPSAAKREPNETELFLADLIVRRAKRAVQDPTPTLDEFSESLAEALRNGTMTKERRALWLAMAQFIDANIKLALAKFKLRAAGNTADTRTTSTTGVALGLYRFVWKAGETYQRGDVATLAGGAWICITPSADRPGTSANWRLMEKDKDMRKAYAR